MKVLLTELGNAINAQGGTERVLANMANEMQRRGHKVYVMVFDRRAGRLYFQLNDDIIFLNSGEGVRYNKGWVNIKNIFVKDGSNGVLCEEGIDAFAEGLSELMEDEELRRRFGQQAKRDMEAYSPTKIWDTWEELMKKVAKNE